MKSLQESLEEQVRSILEKYNASVDSFAGLAGNCKPWDKLSADDQTAIEELLTPIFDGDITLIISDKQEAFKIPRYLAPKLDSLNWPENIECKKGPKETDRAIIVNGRKVALTGSGSIGRVTTAAQELATCVVWNAFVEEVKMMDGSGFALGRVDDIKELVGELSEDFDPAWIASFKEQILCIKGFLESQGIMGWDKISQYRACRYGGADYIDDENDRAMRCKTGKAHEKFVNAYMDMIKRLTGDKRVQKDNFDPSDILIYKPHEGVLQTFNRLAIQCKTAESSEAILDEYRKMFADKELFGISLKKCDGAGKFEIFNISAKTAEQAVDITKVSNNKKPTSQAQSAELFVEGNFNLAGVSDPEHPEQDIQSRKVIVSLRSFGKSNAMDVKEAKGPAIGKVPVRMWTKELGVAESDLPRAVEIFETYTDKSKWGALVSLISGGMKNGPWCLPFVLIH